MKSLIFLDDHIIVEATQQKIGARENIDNLGRVFGSKNWPRVHNWHKK